MASLSLQMAYLCRQEPAKTSAIHPEHDRRRLVPKRIKKMKTSVPLPCKKQTAQETQHADLTRIMMTWPTSLMLSVP